VVNGVTRASSTLVLDVASPVLERQDGHFVFAVRTTSATYNRTTSDN
jgi:hypothetical protein